VSVAGAAGSPGGILWHHDDQDVSVWYVCFFLFLPRPPLSASVLTDCMANRPDRVLRMPVVTVTEAFEPDGAGELQLRPGCRLRVIAEYGEGFYMGENLETNESGVFPKTFVTVERPVAPPRPTRPAPPVPATAAGRAPTPVSPSPAPQPTSTTPQRQAPLAESRPRAAAPSSTTTTHASKPPSRPASTSSYHTPASASSSADTLRSQLASASRSIDSLRYRVTVDYDAMEDVELSLRVGDVVDAVDTQDDLWWLGRCGGQEGRFPSFVVDPVPLPGRHSHAVQWLRQLGRLTASIHTSVSVDRRRGR